MKKKLECRIVIIHKPNKCISLAMFDPLNNRYEALGDHGPDKDVIEREIMKLKRAIESAGHTVTFCERSE